MYSLQNICAVNGSVPAYILVTNIEVFLVLWYNYGTKDVKKELDLEGKLWFVKLFVFIFIGWK